MARNSASAQPSQQIDWLIQSQREERDQLNDELRKLRQLQRSLRTLEETVARQRLVIASAHKALKHARSLPMAPHAQDRVWGAYAACANELGLRHDGAPGNLPDMPAQGAVCLACAR